MSRRDTFVMRVNSDERQAIITLAEGLQRSQSDAVRLVVREAARELSAPTIKAAQPEPANAGA